MGKKNSLTKHVERILHYNEIIPSMMQNVISRILTGIVVGICTLELVMDAGMATGMVWPLGSCKSTGKVPDTGLKEGEKITSTRKITSTMKLKQEQIK